jgi:16S rRNA (adenine1518-N6/adenine1519-N6)-dimethyltransferase
MAKPARPLPGARGRVRRALAQIDRRPRKRYGQHLLADPGIVRRIVDLAGLTGRESVLEIGPGLGALTGELAARCGRLCVVEVDRDFAAQLRERFRDESRVTVVESDVLKVDLTALGPPGTIVVANLPYNISTPVLFRLLEHAERFARLVLMLQREVAERLRAQAGQGAYGVLSVMVQLRAVVHHGLYVHPAAFVPRPRVESEVVVLEPYATPPVAVMDRALFRRVVRAAFQQRRKQLGNSLAAALPAPQRVLASAGIDATRRAETLTLEEFARLANAATDRSP